MLRRSVLGFSLFTLAACPVDDDATGGGGTTETDSTSATSGTASGTMTVTTMSASAGSMTSTADSTTDSTATADNTSDSGDTSGSTTSSGGSGSSSTGAAESTYPPCDPNMDPPCPEGYDACYDAVPGYNVCNVANCETADDCPLANGGEAQVLCIPFRGGTCVLDCPGGLACPEGMECVPLPGTGVERCLWPV